MAPPHPALLALARGAPLPRTDDAAAVLRSAQEHRMTGLLWSRLEAEGGHGWPREQLEALARQDLLVQAHHRRLWQTLGRVVGELAEAGIAVVTAKGVAAERRWYDRTGDRPCVDIDLLLAPAHVARIDEVVALLHPDHPLAGQLAPLLRSGTLQSVDLLVDGIQVDLHGDILKAEVPTRQAARLWERSTLLTRPGDEVPIRALDAEASLVQFLLHLVRDRFGFLLGFVDVARILAREDLDWDFIADFARREGLEAHVYGALSLVGEVLGIDVPAGRVGSGRARVWAALWPVGSALQGRATYTEHRRRSLWIPWTARGRGREAAYWWLRRRVFPPGVLLDYYYPGASGPYLWRLVRNRIVPRDAAGR